MSTAGPPGSTASDFYDVAVAREAPERSQRARRSLWTLFLSLVLPPSAEEFVRFAAHPKLLTSTQIRWKESGEVLISYDYRDEASAMNHARSLQHRLHEMSREEFANEVGIRGREGDRSMDREVLRAPGWRCLGRLL